MAVVALAADLVFHHCCRVAVLILVVAVAAVVLVLALVVVVAVVVAELVVDWIEES